MRSRMILIFVWCFFKATTFSIASRAADIAPDPFVNKPHADPNAEKPQSTLPLENVDVTEPPPEKASPAGYFYKYDSSLSLSAGFYVTFPSDPPVNVYSLINLAYDWPNTTAFHLETGLDSVSVGEGHIWTAARWTQRFTDQWRPFYSVGPGIRIIPQNGLATFLDFSHYFVRGAYGIEYGLEGRSSLRGEIFLASDLTLSLFYGFTVGYSVGL